MHLGSWGSYGYISKANPRDELFRCVSSHFLFCETLYFCNIGIL
ncbi:putative sulfated surface glycoprotein 185-like [Iris pallida]|uniref:Sulfated surface glycoprotein 185-like n=1 Tax=Iris pallida TaxID=29817 RepID=A0AAX6H379_IRIPA|nr:putative sulfated surface glycoprotein 185-like [Iris pallida]